ncbi:hypothetical protein ACFFRR_006177 [Megaselia abdita]
MGNSKLVGFSFRIVGKVSNRKSILDLVAVSSTVIPLSVLEVSYGKNGKPSEEYKMAYLKKLMKKVKHQDGEDDIDPDTLITIKSKGKHIESKAKVKAN